MIKLIKSTFYRERDTKKKLISFISRSKHLSFGAECERFEIKFAKWQGRAHSIMLNSGSSANLAIIQALLNLKRIKTGDEVAFSALTWSTNVMPIIELGLKAIPIDVEIDTLNVSGLQFAKVLKEHPLIKIIFLTNLLGFCSDIEAIAKICKDRKILLIEDNCEALGTKYMGKKLGNYGLAGTFSFYVGHHMSTIEGGAVCTDDDEVATMLRLVRAHGWDRNLSFAKQAEMRKKFHVNSTFYSRYTFYDLGYNLRPTDINGYLGNIQLKYLNRIIARREYNFKYLTEKIYKRRDLYFTVRSDHLEICSNFAVPVICRSKDIRDRLVKMCDGKIEIRPIVGGDMTKQPFFIKHMKPYIAGFTKSHCRLIHEQGLYFGNNPELTRPEMDRIADIFTSL